MSSSPAPDVPGHAATPPPDIPAAIHAYARDWSWLPGVQAFYRVNDVELGEMVACFFPGRRDGFPVEVPAWADLAATQPEAYAALCAEVRGRRGWDPDMSVLGALHLEFIAHDADRLKLTGEWLHSLHRLGPERRALHIMDFGCGASSYAELALNLWPSIRATLVDVDPSVVEYLRFRYSRYGERVRCVAPPATVRLTKRARVDVDHRVLGDRYDAMVMSDVLEHTLDPLAILIHMVRQLNPGGLMFINYPHYIEGDWHTPEAFHMRAWCFRYVRRVCRPGGTYSWFRNGSGRPGLPCLALEMLHPLILWKSRRFARAYFREHGQALVEQVAVRARRQVTVEELLASVG